MLPSETPEELLAAKEEILFVREAIDRLPERERDALRMRFGLDGAEPISYRNIGKRLTNGNAKRAGLGPERARQVTIEAIQRLRHILTAHGSPFHDEWAAKVQSERSRLHAARLDQCIAQAKRVQERREEIDKWNRRYAEAFRMERERRATLEANALAAWRNAMALLAMTRRSHAAE